MVLFVSMETREIDLDYSNFKMSFFPETYSFRTGEWWFHFCVTFKIELNKWTHHYLLFSISVGHTYLTYGPLLNGATSVIFEGTPFHPTNDRFWQVIEKYKVSKFYTAPTAIRALMKFGEDFAQKYDLSSLAVLGTVGKCIYCVSPWDACFPAGMDIASHASSIQGGPYQSYILWPACMTRIMHVQKR